MTNCPQCGKKITSKDKRHKDFVEDGLCKKCRELNLWKTIEEMAKK